jgi:hypothetical protein
MGWLTHPANRKTGESSPAHHERGQVSSSKTLIVRVFIVWMGLADGILVPRQSERVLVAPGESRSRIREQLTYHGIVPI